jgi:hypothetical protein
MPSMTLNRTAAATMLAVALAACGSTVSTTTTTATTGEAPPAAADGLSLPLPDEPGSGVDADGSRLSVGTGGQPEEPGGDPGSSRQPNASAAAPGQPAPDGAPAALAPAGGKATGAPVEVGVTVLVSSQDGAARAGFGEFQTGDSHNQVAAVVKYINAHGGLAGRPVTPVIFEIDGTTTQNYDTLYQSMCDSWTQDHKVVAGIYFRPLSSMVLPACMQNRGAGLVAVGMGNVSAADLARWPLFSTPIWPSMERSYRILVERAAAQGYLRSGAKVGLLRFDTPGMERVAEQQIKPALAKLGSKVDEEMAFTMPENTADLSGITSQMSNAVLRFSTRGINEIIVQDFAALIGILFPQAAASGGYKPAHGYALTSDSLPSYSAQNAPEGQFDGAVGVGWSPSQSGVDVSGQHNPVRNSPAAQRCLTAMKAGGEDMSRDTVRQNAFVYCDLFFLLKDAIDRGGAATAAGYLAGLDALGTGFAPALTFSTRFARGKHDGPAAVRDLFYDGACECFRYRGGDRPL